MAHDYGRANRIARLAVWIGRPSSASTISKPSIFGLLLVSWFSLTALGAWQVSPETAVGPRLADSFYAPFTFLAPQDSYINRAQSELLDHPFLWLGRFFGAAIPVYAVVWAALVWGRHRIAKNLLPWAAGHVVIYANEAGADAMATELVTAGEVVVLAEPEPEIARQEVLMHQGVFLIDDSLPNSLRMSGAERASRVIVWRGEDVRNIADAMEIGKNLTSRHEEILLQVEHPQMRRALRKSGRLLERETARLRPVSLNLMAVRAALGNSDLVLLPRAVGPPAYQRPYFPKERAYQPMRKFATACMTRQASRLRVHTAQQYISVPQTQAAAQSAGLCMSTTSAVTTR